jgi:hypothetical protein
LAIGPIRDIAIFDWYDGLVLAVVGSASDHQTYLAALIAFDPNRRRRVLLLVRLTDDESRRLLALRDRTWEEILATTSAILTSGRNGHALLLDSDQVLSEILVDGAEVKQYPSPDVSNACTSERQRWFDRFA